MNYYFTQRWHLKSELRRVLTKYISNDKPNRILEIGSFEGGSACNFSDNVMDHPESSLVCVDPFYLSGSDKTTSQCVTNQTKERFCENILKSKNSDKILFHQLTSDEYFTKTSKKFTFIYIDGNHDPQNIISDLENSFNHIELNGIIWMDDYLGGKNGYIKKTIDDTLKKYIGRFEIIHSNYQLAIKIIY